MSVKVHFPRSHVNYFPENLEAMIEEQGEFFHQDIKTIEKIPGMLEYQNVGRLLLVLRKRLLAVATPEKHSKDNFYRAIFSVMKKEYAIMFGLFFAFWRCFVTTVFALQGHNICAVSHLCLVSHSCKYTVYTNWSFVFV